MFKKSILMAISSLFLLQSNPAQAMQAQSFPFDGDIQKLTPIDIKVQKYKLQRLRINLVKGRWYIIRGINDKIDDFNLLKLVGRTQRIKEHEMEQLIGNSVALGGVVLVGAGGLMVTKVIQIQYSNTIGLALILTGGGMAIAGEMMAGNIGDEYFHIIEMDEAEKYIAEYNEKLKRKLGVNHLKNLD